MNAPIAVAHPRLGDLSDPGLQMRPVRAAALVVVGRPFCTDHATSSPDRDRPGAAQIIDDLPPPAGRHSFLLITSCSIALSRDRSATNFFSLLFSSSSCFSRFISEGSNPPYFFRQL